MARTVRVVKQRTVVEINPEVPKKEHRTGRRYQHDLGGPGINIPESNPQMLIASTGRPAIYDPYRFPHIAYVLCRTRGFTAAELAQVFDVSKKTVDFWMWQRPEFKDAVRRGKDEYDSEDVENALRKRAIGYSYTETHRTKTKIVGKLQSGVTVEVPAIQITTIEKQVAPDPRSAMYWLQNRQPDRWKNTLKIEADINNRNLPQTDVQEIDVDNMSTTELLALREIISTAAETQQKTLDISDPAKQLPSVDEILSAADKAMARQTP